MGVDEFPEDLKEFNPYRREMLGRIDPCSGLYKKVEYPEHVKNECTLVHPVKLKDSVAVLIQSPGEYVNPMVDLYVLDERAANWTKLHTIGPLPFDGLRIPQCFNTGEIVLETWEGDILHADRVPFFCDPETGGVLYNNGMEWLDFERFTNRTWNHMLLEYSNNVADTFIFLKNQFILLGE